MVDIGPVAAVLVAAWAFGAFWYHFWGHNHSSLQRTLIFPLVAVLLGEGLWAPYFVAGPEVLGIHIAVSLVTTFAAVYADIALETKGILPSRYIHGLHLDGVSKLNKVKGIKVPTRTAKAAAGNGNSTIEE